MPYVTWPPVKFYVTQLLIFISNFYFFSIRHYQIHCWHLLCPFGLSYHPTIAKYSIYQAILTSLKPFTRRLLFHYVPVIPSLRNWWSSFYLTSLRLLTRASSIYYICSFASRYHSVCHSSLRYLVAIAVLSQLYDLCSLLCRFTYTPLGGKLRPLTRLLATNGYRIISHRVAHHQGTNMWAELNPHGRAKRTGPEARTVALLLDSSSNSIHVSTPSAGPLHTGTDTAKQAIRR